MRFRSLAGAAVVAIAASVAAIPASAAPASAPVTLKTVQVDRIVVLEEHETANGGYVKFKVERATVPAHSTAAAVKPMTIKSVGGGTWDYGPAATGSGKACHSYYNHPSVSHGSTVKLGSKSDSDSAGAGSTSFAYVKGSFGATCQAFWNK